MYGNARVYTILLILFVSVVTLFGFILGVFVFAEQAGANNVERRSHVCDVTDEVIKTALHEGCDLKSTPLLTVNFHGKHMECGVTTTKAYTSKLPSVKLKDIAKVCTFYSLKTLDTYIIFYHVHVYNCSNPYP